MVHTDQCGFVSDDVNLEVKFQCRLVSKNPSLTIQHSPLSNGPAFPGKWHIVSTMGRRGPPLKTMHRPDCDNNYPRKSGKSLNLSFKNYPSTKVKSLPTSPTSSAKSTISNPRTYCHGLVSNYENHTNDHKEETIRRSNQEMGDKEELQDKREEGDSPGCETTGREQRRRDCRPQTHEAEVGTMAEGVAGRILYGLPFWCFDPSLRYQSSSSDAMFAD